MTPNRAKDLTNRFGRTSSESLPAKKEKPILKRVKDGKKIAMKKKINIGVPISFQIYTIYLNGEGILVKRTCPSLFRRRISPIFQVWARIYHRIASAQKTLSVPW